jgi:predicted anti-sigma-YlaC factor YlaD
MNCNEFELLLADAIGGELGNADRPVFERHLAECATCRKDYETTLGTVSRLRSLSAAEPGVVNPVRAGSLIRPSPPPWATSLLRYAASILIAFVAGYVASNLRTARDARPIAGPTPSFQDGTNDTKLASASFGAALAETYRENPSRSELSRCLSAMFSKRN